MKPLLLICLSHVLLAQAPRILNAKVETRSGASLESTFRGIVAAQEGPAWVAYTVPSAPGAHNSCRWSYGAKGPVMLEGSSELVVLYRISNHAVDKTFPVSGDCEIDAGGLPFIQLTGVRPSESVALLTSMVTEKKDQALSAIAMHGDASAVTTLLDLAKKDQRPAIRGKALFWLAQRAGQREMAAIVSSLDNDPDLEVKKKAVFSLTQIPKDEGVPKLIEVARANRSPEVRKQAMFWLGQSKDPRALQFFQDVLTK